MVTCSVLIAHESIHHSGQALEERKLMVSELKEPTSKYTLDSHSVSYSKNKNVRLWWPVKVAEDKPKKTVLLTIRNKRREFLQVEFSDVLGKCEARWISEKLLFLRVHWDKEWGGDHILNIESGKTIYSEKFTKMGTH